MTTARSRHTDVVDAPMTVGAVLVISFVLYSFKPKHPLVDLRLFRNRNHSGWDERAEAVTAEIARLASLRDAQGRADWRTHFVHAAR